MITRHNNKNSDLLELLIKILIGNCANYFFSWCLKLDRINHVLHGR
jgi:hypothetical protein